MLRRIFFALHIYSFYSLYKIILQPLKNHFIAFIN